MWGTCLGFELMSLVFANNKKILSPLEGANHLGNLNFLEDAYNHSRLFRNFNRLLTEHVKKNNLLYFNHKFGISPEKFFKEPKLFKNFRAIAIGHDLKSKSFIAAAEALNYPFYGV